MGIAVVTVRKGQALDIAVVIVSVDIAVWT